MTEIDRYTVWGLAGLATVAVIFRPWRLPEAVWPVAAALLIVMSGALSPAEAWHGVSDGTDVYLFLAGMMLLAELARAEGLFDWLAAESAHLAGGSARRLFLLVYLVGTLVTVFLSNDATAVVLTPAVIAMTRAARVPSPTPYLLICAMVANAASFVLPISNPANLVIYADRMPALGAWLARFSVPSAVAIAATLGGLYWTQRRLLRAPIGRQLPAVQLSRGARVTALGIVFTAIALMGASAASLPLGLSTLTIALLTIALVSICTRRLRLHIVSGLAWSVFALVAGLFVLVRALDATGVIELLRSGLLRSEASSAHATTFAWASVLALVCNIANNLPAALLAGRVMQVPQLSANFAAATVVAVDVGPNLSVSGSLATLLWLAALRREGLDMRARDFLLIGAVVMPAAFILALAAILLNG